MSAAQKRWLQSFLFLYPRHVMEACSKQAVDIKVM